MLGRHFSGSRVVNSESHFPQSNLTRLGVTDDDKIVSDESIFWDIYVETVISFLNSAIKLTPERLIKPQRIGRGRLHRHLEPRLFGPV